MAPDIRKRIPTHPSPIFYKVPSLGQDRVLEKQKLQSNLDYLSEGSKRNLLPLAWILSNYCSTCVSTFDLDCS